MRLKWLLILINVSLISGCCGLAMHTPENTCCPVAAPACYENRCQHACVSHTCCKQTCRVRKTCVPSEECLYSGCRPQNWY
jgi:hypothetical protein